MRRLLAVTASLILIALTGIAGLTAWLSARDPMAVLPRAGGPLALTAEQPFEHDGRDLRHLSFYDPVLGTIGLVVSLPDPLPEGPLPVIVVLGGLGTGVQNVSHVGDAGDNAIIGYDWPMPARLPDGRELLRETSDLYRQALRVPGQMTAGLHWVLEQPWADRDRVSLLGFSLGALAAPAVQRTATAEGIEVGWTVLAYAGAPIGDLIAGHPRLEPDWSRPILRMLGNLLLRPVDPVEHLPHLTGRFLLLGGMADSLIPETAAIRMRTLTPDPKDIVLFEGEHMGVGPSQLTLLESIIRTSSEWLIEQGAATPLLRQGAQTACGTCSQM